MTTRDPFAIEDDEQAQSTPVLGELVTKARFAAIIGKADKTITKMIGAGMPVVSVGLRKGVATKIDTAVAINWFIRRESGLLEADEGATAMDSAKVRDKDAQASLRELDLRKRQGELVPVEEVRLMYREKIGGLRARILTIPGRVAEAVAALKDPAAVEKQIATEINEALAELSGHKWESEDDDSDS